MFVVQLGLHSGWTGSPKALYLGTAKHFCHSTCTPCLFCNLYDHITVELVNNRFLFPAFECLYEDLSDNMALNLIYMCFQSVQRALCACAARCIFTIFHCAFCVSGTGLHYWSTAVWNVVLHFLKTVNNQQNIIPASEPKKLALNSKSWK